MSMDGFTSKSTISVKPSRSGQLVPMVDGVLLHSIYNPLKESESLIEKYRTQIETKTNFLILGLGYGYHIETILNYCKSTQPGVNKDICIIEPNTELMKKCLLDNYGIDFNGSDSLTFPYILRPGIKIFHGYSVETYYQSTDFLKFLTMRPALIPHPASFNLHQDFFKRFLSYESPSDLGSILQYVQEGTLKKYLSRFDPNITLMDAIEKIKTKRSDLTREDFILLAMNHCAKCQEDQI